MAIIDKLNAIADQIRVLHGSTEKINMTEMASNINEANNEINEQAGLISQIISILESKSSNDKST